jgi:hypothetical protein
LVLERMVLQHRCVDIAIDKVTVATPDFDGKPQARDFKYKVEKPALNDFEDISKIRNREDKKLLSIQTKTSLKISTGDTIEV